MGMFDGLFNTIGKFTAFHLMEFSQAQQKYVMDTDKRRKYMDGEQDKQLKTLNGQDDNVYMNMCGIAVSRSVDMLMSGGVKFTVEDETQQAFLDEVMKANRQEILLHNAAILAGQSGHGFIKIVTTNGEVTQIPRLLPPDPVTVDVITPPEDVSKAIEYQISYPVVDEKKNKVVARRQRIYFEAEHDESVVPEEVQLAPDRWILQWQEKQNNGRWKDIGDAVIWSYAFPPLVDWQNEANPLDYKGKPDITDDLIALQDKTNFTVSNISKILKIHASPVVWMKGVNFNDDKRRKEPLVPGAIYPLPEGGEMGALEMQSDLGSSMAFYKELKETFFAVSRTVNMADQSLGNFTDYQLKVLYRDAIAKTKMKRLLFGEALEELCNNLLTLRFGEGHKEVVVEFGEMLPENPDEEIERRQKELAMGIVSKETTSTKAGYSWEDESEKIDTERMKEDTVGSRLIEAFNKGF